MHHITAVDQHGRVLQTLVSQKPITTGCAAHPDAYAYIESAPPADEHYWDFERLEWSVSLSRPSQNHIFNWTTKQWQDPRTLDDLKAAQWAAIKAARDRAELGPFTYNGMEFDGDLNAQRRLAGYISVSKSALLAGTPFSAEFTLADNSQVTLSAADFVGVELAKVQAVAAAFAHAVVLRGQLDAASTAAEVAAVGW